MDDANRTRYVPESNSRPDAERRHPDIRHQAAESREKRMEQRRERLDKALDKALEESFPGSDPVSVIQPAGSMRK